MRWRSSFANLEALCRQSIGSFGNDDPGYEVRDSADAGKESEDRSDNTHDIEIPTVVEGEAGADSGDHAVVARTRELSGVWVKA